MEQSATGISVIVEDNGKGFDSSSASTGFGLGHIASRAEELNGTCEVTSNEGEGTRIFITIPLEDESASK
jgi:signal transduction histidine kinase